MFRLFTEWPPFVRRKPPRGSVIVLRAPSGMARLQRPPSLLPLPLSLTAIDNWCGWFPSYALYYFAKTVHAAWKRVEPALGLRKSRFHKAARTTSIQLNAQELLRQEATMTMRCKSVSTSQSHSSIQNPRTAHVAISTSQVRRWPKQRSLSHIESVHSTRIRLLQQYGMQFQTTYHMSCNWCMDLFLTSHSDMFHLHLHRRVLE